MGLKLEVCVSAFKIESDPDHPPDPAAHAHTAVRPAGSQIIEGREPVERAGQDARYRVVFEVPRGGEGRERVKVRTKCDSA